MDGSIFEVAVTVPVPVFCPAVTSPEELIVAIVPPLDDVMDQLTGVVLLVLPSLKVPTANI